MSETQPKPKPLNLELRGRITTVTEFANSPPGAEENKTRLLPSMPLHEGGGVVAGVPFMPASAIRGMLRRAAAEVAASVFADGRVGFEDWMLFAVGGVKGSGEDDCDLKERREYIEANPLVALFGAGEAAADQHKIGGMIGSKLHIAHAVPGPEVKAVTISGARFHEDKSPRMLEVLTDRGMMDLIDERNKKAAQKAKGKKDGEDEKTEKPFIGMPLPGYEVIPRDVEIDHRMTLAAVTPAQFGFFLEALKRFAVDPVVGAHRSHGCGRIRMEYHVYRRDDEGKREWLGDIRVGEFPPEADGESGTGKKQPPPKTLGPFFECDDGVNELAAAWRETVKPENLRPFGAGKPPAESSAKKKAAKP